jgi:hypothetical protein
MGIGELRDVVPLPWLACFKGADLVSCPIEITGEDGSQRTEHLLSPCTTIESAMIDLIRSKPFFEKLTGEGVLAGEYWQRAVTRMKQYKLPYLTLDYVDLLGFSKPAAVNDAVSAGLTWTDAGFEQLKNMFLAWTDGLRPLASAQLDGFRGADKDRFLNGMSLDINNLAVDDARSL